MTTYFTYEIQNLTKQKVIDRKYLSDELSAKVRSPTKDEIWLFHTINYGVLEPERYIVLRDETTDEKHYAGIITNASDWDKGLFQNIIEYDENQKTYHLILPDGETIPYRVIRDLKGKIMLRGSQNGLKTNIHVYCTDESDWVLLRLIYDSMV